MPIPQKGHRNLRQARVSVRGCLYFVTVCAEHGSDGLTCGGVFLGALTIFDDHSRTGHAQLHGMVVMPDHIHLLFELGTKGELSGIIRSFKGRLSPVLRDLSIRWQKGSYFDRRLRTSDSPGAVLRYIKLNPYRKGLARLAEQWPFWYCSEPARKWLHSVDSSDPPPLEWL